MAIYELALARQEDFRRCMDILDTGREFQRQQGFIQWPDGFPDEESILCDIRSGLGYVVKVDGAIAAYLYLGFDGDPAYPAIRGAWGYEENYGVIHPLPLLRSFAEWGLLLWFSVSWRTIAGSVESIFCALIPTNKTSGCSMFWLKTDFPIVVL